MATPPVFSAGAVLTAAQMNKIGMWLIKSETITSNSASKFISDVFSSDFECYHINIKARALNEGSYQMCMGNTTNNTSGWYGVIDYYSYTGAPDGFIRINNAASTNVGLSQNQGWTMTTMDMWNPYLSDYTLYTGNSWGRDRYMGTLAGELANTTSYTGFTIFNDAGNLSAGRISVYGYRQ
jgi:hypothetical protein